MADRIPYIVGKRSNGEGKVIYIVSVSEKRQNKVATAHVVREIAEERLAKGIIPEILDEATAIRV